MFMRTVREADMEKEKYKVIYVFYVVAGSYGEAQDNTKDLRLEDADEKTVIKMRK